MSNKRIQYINLLLPTILYFLLFMLEAVLGHGITKALFTVYFVVFIILFFVILFAVLHELYIINFVVAKDKLKSDFQEPWRLFYFYILRLMN